MLEVGNPEDLLTLSENNAFWGTLPKMQNSVIKFVGSGNLLFCEENVRLVNTTLTFSGSDSIIYLSHNQNEYKLNATLYHDCTLSIGENCYFNGSMTIILSEQSHFLTGKESIFSYGITVRTADPHLIYNCNTYERINPTKSIYVGDHVWIGQSVIMLKGTHISSGSIIGAGSVISGRKIPHNTSWAGNPVRMIAQDVFWDGSCVHMWTEKERERAKSWKEYAPIRKADKDSWIFHKDEKELISYDDIDRELNYKHTLESRIEYLESLNKINKKNRFAFDVE